jgi:uncharacterized membrane protein YagU involved in acid resistance
MVLAGGLVAGTLDILYACLFWSLKSDVPAERILQSVAAGLLGSSRFAGGSRTAALGLLLHFLIATTMAAVYYLAARRWPRLWQQPWLFGAVYGTLLYVVMSYLVVPLSAAGPGSRDPLWVSLTFLVHVLFVGIPCAFFARWALLHRP